MKELRVENYQSYQLVKDVSYVRTDHNRYIVKILKLSFVRRLIDYIKRGRCLAFENEIKVYHSLEYQSFTLLNHPKLIHSDGKSYMVLEHIDGTRGWDKRIISTSDFITALLEFQFCKIKIETNLLKKILMRWYCKVPCKIFRWSFLLIKSPKDIRISLRCIWITLKNVIMIKKYKHTILMHNDLFYYNNIITGYDNNVYFYDFEYAMEENKWLLLDILDLSFDLSTLEFKPRLFLQYLKQISIHRSMYSYITNHIIGLTRVILIRKVMGALLSNSTKLSSKMACKKFLNDILLSEQEYLKWYIKNIKPCISYMRYFEGPFGKDFPRVK